jgi:hypothetical protein
MRGVVLVGWIGGRRLWPTTPAHAPSTSVQPMKFTVMTTGRHSGNAEI